MARLKAQTHYNHYTPANVLYTSRWAASVPTQAFPAIVLQGGNTADGSAGRVYYKASASNLPQSARELVKQIREALRRPCPTPAPTPGPTPVQPVVVPLIPDIGPPHAPPHEPADEGDNTLFLAVLAAVGAAAVTFISQFKSRVQL